MVSGIRPYQTKTGKMMAWVTLEDLTGVIELVLFPRTWEKYQFALEVGGVIIAEGKVDAQSNPSKVLVDNIRTEIKLTTPAQIPLQPQPSGNERKASPNPTVLSGNTPLARPAAGNGKPTSSPRSAPASRPTTTDEPPMPEDPPDWDDFSTGNPGVAAPVVVPSLIASETNIPEEVIADTTGSIGGFSTDVVIQPEPILPPPAVLAPKLPADTLPLNIEDEHAPQMVTVILRPTGDPNRDIRRISRLHGTFISHPGRDRFAFQIFEEGRGHLIEFPNDTTHLCTELAALLTDTVGEENVRIEPILYQ
jgi:DNA polymerase-3 subunit alpha